MITREILSLWPLPDDASAHLINVSENHTFLVDAPGWRSVLRLHRPGYHSRRAIECELSWSSALRASRQVATPGVIPGRNGDNIQSAMVDGAPHHLVMFEHVPGVQPSEDEDLTRSFRGLGRLAARTHVHSIAWQRPAPFERLSWTEGTVFGANATWGDWRRAPNVTVDVSRVLEEVEATVNRRLNAFGKEAERFGLIHADMRLANLLIDGDTTWLIDFDDCGMGWFLYDFAAAISFIEDHPQVPALKDAWVDGYRGVRPMSATEEAEIETFVMLRRMALLAWIGTHIEAPEPKAHAPRFASVTAELGEAYLSKFC